MNETTDTKSMTVGQQIATEVAVTVVLTAVAAATFMAISAVSTVIINKSEARRIKKFNSKKH